MVSGKLLTLLKVSRTVLIDTSPMNPLRILIIDDDEQVRQLLEQSLRIDQYDVVSVESGRAALRAIETSIFDAALIDINLGDMTGLGILEAIKGRDSDIDAVMMTGSPDVDTAVQALRLGAYDYLTKPLVLEALRHLLKRIAEKRYLRSEVVSLRSRLTDAPPIGEIIGQSVLVQQLRELIAKVADTDSSVLIEGESGTGKELIAYALHRLSSRIEGPFVAVNCAAIPAELLESELFGHVKGAFSSATSESRGLFRSAEGGTLFLDEIGDLPLSLQPKLLRVVQEMEVRPVGSTQTHPLNIRLVTATNRHLKPAVHAGKFREDLYFRLNVVRIEPPPLRKIKEDIPQLVMHFVRKLNRRFGRRVQSVTPEAMSLLLKYDYPGNVRELENIIERAFALGANLVIAIADLPSLHNFENASAVTLRTPMLVMEDLQRDLVSEAMRTNGNDKLAAAKALGMSERTLYRRLKVLGLG